MNIYEHIAERCLQERAQRLPTWREKVKRFKSSEALVDYMERHIGLKKLGGGHYSVAYRGLGGRDFVLKASRSVSRGQRDHWLSFAFDVADTKIYERNPLFPRIEKENLFIFEDGTFACFLEYLSIGDVKIQWPITDALRHAGLKVGTVDVVFDKASEECASEDTNRPYTKAISRAINTTEKYLVEYLQFINYYLGNSIKTDLHSENIGFRQNGQIVLFDPIADRITVANRR